MLARVSKGIVRLDTLRGPTRVLLCYHQPMGKQVVILKTRRRNNPNNVNQYTDPDPRQQLFLATLLDPKSPTFSNVLQSAMSVGYSETYASNLTVQMPKWLSENLGRLSMLQKAERNLEKVLDLTTRVQALGAFGPVFAKETHKVKVKLKNGKTVLRNKVVKVPIMKEDSHLLKIKTDTSEFIAERIGREVYGKNGSDGPPINNIFIFNDTQRARIARRVLTRDQPGAGASD